MNSFSRSQAVSLILVTLIFLLFYGWRHQSLFWRIQDTNNFFPLGVVVQVSGKVRDPGNYSFDQSVSVSEALNRAGGLISSLQPQPGWDKLYIDNGRRIHIVADANGFSRLRLGWMTVPSRLALGVQLNVNQASVEDLALVPGISHRLAKNIVAHRQRLGGFSRLEDLLLVDGIGPVSLKRLRQYLSVGNKEKGTGYRVQGTGQIYGIQ